MLNDINDQNLALKKQLLQIWYKLHTKLWEKNAHSKDLEQFFHSVLLTGPYSLSLITSWKSKPIKRRM